MSYHTQGGGFYAFHTSFIMEIVILPSLNTLIFSPSTAITVEERLEEFPQGG